MYKLPKHFTTSKQKEPSKLDEKAGLRYMFVTNNIHDKWLLSNRSIDMIDSLLAINIQETYKDENTLLFAYNDEFPDGTVKVNGGHAKGVLATDGVTGYWLIHSIPKYPMMTTDYEYPTTGRNFGQSCLCISFSASEMEKIGQQLLFNQVHVYYSRIPISLKGKFPSLELILAKKWNRSEPYYGIQDIYTLGGERFRSFAKSSKYKMDLYEDLMAPELQSSLFVESWRNGGGNFQSNCSLQQKVYNVQELEHQGLAIDFKSTQDHAKWAVSQNTGLKLWHWRLGTSPDWICVGDINRQQGQLNRGGGQLCQKHKQMAKLYRSLIKDYEHC